LAEPKFETALKRLEDIVDKMEEGGLTLDESLKLFEEGVKLSRTLNKRLTEAEKKVEKLVRDAEGTLGTVPMEEDDVPEDED